MNDERLRRLLHETVDDLAPADRLAEIRAGLHSEETPMITRKYALVAAAALAAAAVVAGIAWAGGAFEPASQVPPAEQPTVTVDPTADPEPAQPTPAPDPSGDHFTAAVYYLGETPMGVRLFREFQQVTGETHLLAAVRAAIAGTPQDPDYWTPWPDTEVVAAEVAGDVIRIELDTVPDATDAADPAEAAQALEQVIHTAQAAVGDRLPLQFMTNSNPVAEVFGQPTSEPLAEGTWSDVLSLVSISDPAEGTTVSDGVLDVTGVASSFEATVPWRILRDGAEVDRGFFTAEGWGDRLHPYGGEIDVTGLDPGTYLFEVSTDDPSAGEGPGPFVDTRTFQIR